MVPTWTAVTNVATSQKVSNVKVDAFDRVDKVGVEVEG